MRVVAHSDRGPIMQGHHQTPCQIQLSSDIPDRISISYHSKRDAEPTIDVSATIVQYSWLSTQVYTPFGRIAEFAKLIFSFAQVKSLRFRKVDCQKFQTPEVIRTRVYTTECCRPGKSTTLAKTAKIDMLKPARDPKSG